MDQTGLFDTVRLLELICRPTARVGVLTPLAFPVRFVLPEVASVVAEIGKQAGLNCALVYLGICPFDGKAVDRAQCGQIESTPTAGFRRPRFQELSNQSH